MPLTLARWTAGLALLTALIAGCGTASASHAPVAAHTSASPVPTATHLATPVKAQVPGKKTVVHRHRRHRHPTPVVAAPTPLAPPPTMNPIPQDNGGDHDFDNNGGPSDGDGNV